MNSKLSILAIIILIACDLDISNSDSNDTSYIINANLEIKSNTNFSIASALVIMEWHIDYYTSNRDSGYTDSNGEINLQAQLESNYLLNETPIDQVGKAKIIHSNCIYIESKKGYYCPLGPIKCNGLDKYKRLCSPDEDCYSVNNNNVNQLDCWSKRSDNKIPDPNGLRMPWVGYNEDNKRIYKVSTSSDKQANWCIN